MEDARKALVIADLHIPFVDLLTFQYFMDKIYETKPDLIIIAGDFMDFYGISRFDSSPHRADDLEYELTCGREILRKIRSITNCAIKYVIGNHEIRLEQFLSRGKNKALFNLSCLKIENLLDFKKYNIEKIDDIYRLNENFIVTHGSKCGVSCAQAEGLSYMISGMSGHAHKSAIFIRNFLNYHVKWYSIGCMCIMSELKYATKFSHSWNNGFGEITYNDIHSEIKLYSVRNGMLHEG